MSTALPGPRRGGRAMCTHGFTLVELLAVLAIVAILATMVPSLNRVVAANRLAVYTNSFIGAARYARNESIMRSRTVVLCASSDGVNCANANGWEQGWIIFVDNNSNAAYDGGTELLLRVSSKLGGRFTLTNGTVRSISYRPSGMPSAIGTWVLCDSYSAGGSGYGQTIEISAIGRAEAVNSVNCP